MSFTNKLRTLRKPYLKDLLTEEIVNESLHGCRVLDFPNGFFPKGWMNDKKTIIKNIKDLDNYNIITRPTRLLVIEFDKNNTDDYAKIRCSALYNVIKVTEFLDSMGIYYIVCDHNKHETSYSPHIYILFKDLPLGKNGSIKRFNEHMRIFFIYYLQHKIKFNESTKIDLNFYNISGNMPLIFQIHWKGKHKGSVQELIKEGNGDKLITIDFIIENYVKM